MMNVFRRFLMLGPFLALLQACTDIAPREGGDILVMGDSVLWWNSAEGNSVGDALGRALDRPVVSKAVPGAQFDNGSRLAGAVGFDVSRQFPGGRWNWIVLNGGANDLSADCECGACAATVDGLISADASRGAIPTLISQVQAESGARVLWMGYYAGNGAGSFEGCRGDLVRMEERLARFAAASGDVFFVDSEDVIDPRDPQMFASDNTHPSARASAIIGAYLARTIAAQGRSQTSG